MVVFVHSWNKTLFYHPGCYFCYLKYLSQCWEAGSAVPGWIEPKLQMQVSWMKTSLLADTKPSMNYSGHFNLCCQQTQKREALVVAQGRQIALVQNSFANIWLYYLNVTNIFLIVQTNQAHTLSWHFWLPSCSTVASQSRVELMSSALLIQEETTEGKMSHCWQLINKARQSAMIVIVCGFRHGANKPIRVLLVNSCQDKAASEFWEGRAWVKGKGCMGCLLQDRWRLLLPMARNEHLMWESKGKLLVLEPTGGCAGTRRGALLWLLLSGLCCPFEVHSACQWSHWIFLCYMHGPRAHLPSLGL